MTKAGIHRNTAQSTLKCIVIISYEGKVQSLILGSNLVWGTGESFPRKGIFELRSEGYIGFYYINKQEEELFGAEGSIYV